MSESLTYQEEIITEPAAENKVDIEQALISINGFREYDVRWLIDKELNYKGIFLLGLAFGTMLQEDYQLKQIVVGYDYRSYSQSVKNSFVIGLLNSGIDVVDIGLSLSPTLYFAQYFLKIKGGAMITASHNENGWTGVKLGYDYSRTLGPEGIKRLKEILFSKRYCSGKGAYSVNPSLRGAYIEDVLSKAKTKKKLKVVVATGNGTAGFFTPEIIKRAGHEVVERHTTLDWSFPHFNPNPEDIAFLEDIGQAVRKEKADLGIGIDGDGDRLGVVDENGEEIFSDKIGLLLARSMAKENKGETFVVDVKSTGLFLVDKVLSENNCQTVYWKTGHSYIKSKVHQLKALAGFEKSGHFFLSGQYGRAYDDGSLSAITFCNLLSASDKSVSQLLAELPKSYQSPTMAPYCDDQVKYQVVEDIKQSFVNDQEAGKLIDGEKIEELITVNGVRVQFSDKSWGLVRASSNKPSLVVVAESFSKRKRIYQIIEDIEKRLEQTGKVGEWDQRLPQYKDE